MGASKRNIALSKLHLSLRKSTVCWVRFVFNGVSAAGGERMFFIEMESINPALSPDKVALGYKFNANIKIEDLTAALAGTQAASDIGKEDTPPPSYIAVRAGTFGTGAKQLVLYEKTSSLVTDKGKLCSVAGCTFEDDTLTGSISLSKEDALDHPEYMCDTGKITWSVKYLCNTSFRALYNKGTDRWMPLGARATFSGTVVLDGAEYEVSGNRSYGYVDFSECKKGALPLPYFHISSSRLTSHITGRPMTDSCFVVHGLYGNAKDRVAVGLKLGDRVITLPVTNGKVKTIQECVEAPADEGGERLHWSMSVELNGSVFSGRYVVDIDVMCHTNLLYVRNIELPEGNRKLMRLLAGGDGVGTVRLFQYVKKNLVLVEEAHIASSFCEFGQADTGWNG